MDVSFKRIEKSIVFNKMMRYSGEGNIHSSEEEAKKSGLGGVIVQGGQLVGYLTEMMLQTFGLSYLDRGEISVTFLVPVRPGDTVFTCGSVKETIVDGDRQVLDCEIWLENQSEQTVAVGSAKVAVA